MDRQCFGLDLDIHLDELANMPSDSRRNREMPDEESSLNTQMAYGTQVVHRGQRPHDVARRQAEAPPKNNNDAAKEKLLGLLHRPPGITAPKPYAHASGPPSAGGFARSSTSRVSDNHSPQPAERLRPAQLPPAYSVSKGDVVSHEEIAAPSTASQSEEEELEETKPTWLQNSCLLYACGKVPAGQQKLLSQRESWQKSREFPSANIPIKVLEALKTFALSKALTDSTPSTDDSNDQSSGAPVTQEDDEVLSDADEESQLSWSRSPSPEQPAQPRRRGPSLPPDSSYEADAGIDIRDEHDEEDQEQHAAQPMVIESSNEEVVADPASSLPLNSAAADSDDEMELDVPRSLEERIVPHDAALHAPDARLPEAVLVKETPYTKGKKSCDIISPSHAQLQDSSGTSKDTSSTSIVYCTYKEPKSSGSEVHTATNALRHRISPALDQDDENQIDQEDNDMEDVEYQRPQGQAAFDADENEVQERNESEALRVENLRLSPVPAPALAPPVKRNIELSPTSKDGRKPKRRQIKIVPFGGGNSLSRDVADQSLRGRGESRGRQSLNLEDGDKMDTDTNPEMGLQSGLARPLGSDKEQDTEGVTTDTKNRLSTSLAHKTNKEGDLDAVHAMSAAPAQSRTNTAFAQLPETSPAPTSTSKVQKTTIVDPQPTMGATIFQTFKNTYLEYTGNGRNFLAQCKQMEKLDLEDKMVPKWQWDDFLVRYRTDYYPKYTNQCFENGEDAEPYHRFYKDTFRDTLFTKGVIASRKILVAVIKELEDETTTTEAAPIERPAAGVVSTNNTTGTLPEDLTATKPSPAASVTTEDPFIKPAATRQPPREVPVATKARPDKAAAEATGTLVEDAVATKPSPGASATTMNQSIHPAVTRQPLRQVPITSKPQPTKPGATRAATSTPQSTKPLAVNAAATNTQSTKSVAANTPKLHRSSSEQSGTKKARQSLPSAFNRGSAQSVPKPSHERPRQAPAASEPHRRSSTPLMRQSSGRPSIPTEPTGDPYRDFVFAQTRVTSSTGDRNVHPPSGSLPNYKSRKQ